MTRALFIQPEHYQRVAQLAARDMEEQREHYQRVAQLAARVIKEPQGHYQRVAQLAAQVIKGPQKRDQEAAQVKAWMEKIRPHITARARYRRDSRAGIRRENAQKTRAMRAGKAQKSARIRAYARHLYDDIKRDMSDASAAALVLRRWCERELSRPSERTLRGWIGAWRKEKT